MSQFEFKVLTDYYRFEKKDDTKSRIDCIASTKGYMPFEQLRTKRTKSLSLYMQANNFTKAGYMYKSKYNLGKIHSISSMFSIDNDDTYMYGDVKGTDDCLLFILHDVKYNADYLQKGAVIEVFVARGQKEFSKYLCGQLAKGELKSQIAELRKRVTNKVTVGGFF